MKKILTIVGVVVLGPILLVSVVARAAGDWRQIGEAADGAKVSVSSVRAQKKTQRTAWVRIEYKEATKLPQGGPFVEMRARARFACSTGAVTPIALWFYSRDRSGKIVVSKKAAHDDQFGKESEGGFKEMVAKYVCEQK